MDDFVYLSLILIIVIILVLLNTNCINNNMNILKKKFKILDNNNKENFACYNNLYKKNTKKKILGNKKNIIYKYPLVEKNKKHTDNLGWRNFYKKKFGDKIIDCNDNFKGTKIRNYLDNLVYFLN